MDKELSTSVLKRIACMLIIAIILLNSNSPVQAATNESCSISKYITVDNKEMHVVLYGELDQNGGTFANQSKEILVMLPALAVPSPNIYFKPLAEALDSAYNVVVIEPFGYGLSDTTESVRTIENINNELYEALKVLDIDTCTLLVHSIAGIYGLHFLYSYPEKVNSIISMDNTVYTEELSEALLLEQEYMLLATEEFNHFVIPSIALRNLRLLLLQILPDMEQSFQILSVIHIQKATWRSITKHMPIVVTRQSRMRSLIRSKI